MAKKIAALLIFGFVTATSLSACYTAGRATGEAAEGVEEGARQFERGYEERRR
jgi:hypothetical protein